jgi:hypothetical protein
MLSSTALDLKEHRREVVDACLRAGVFPIGMEQLPARDAGRMWWSFYESDARWKTFIIRALAYTAGMPEVAMRLLLSPEREDRLLHLLNESGPSSSRSTASNASSSEYVRFVRGLGSTFA